MIEMFFPWGDNAWNAPGLVHVNNRIKGIMKNFLDEYIDNNDQSYTKNVNTNGRERPIEENIDFIRLRTDMKFSEYLHDEGIAPENGWERSASAFVSLYMLVSVRGIYKADLVMEYILLRLLETELDWIEDNDEDDEIDNRSDMLALFNEMPDNTLDVWTTASMMGNVGHIQYIPIPEPARSVMEYAIEKSGIIDEYNKDLEEGEEPYTADSFLKRYEDLEEYLDWCFEDQDCLLLDDISEEEMEKSGLADIGNIHVNGDIEVKKMTFPGSSNEVTLRMAPWETEFAEMMSGRAHKGES